MNKKLCRLGAAGKKAAPLLAGIMAQVLFGFTMLFIKRGMAAVHNDTIKYLAFRYVTGFLCMTLLILLGVCKVNFRGKALKFAVICGLCNPVCSQVFETVSTLYAPTAQISMLSSTCPIIVVILGVALFHERVTPLGVGFCILSVLGVFLTALGPMEGTTTIGLVLIIALVLIVSFGRIFMREARLSLSAFETVYITTGMGALAFSSVTLVTHAVQGDLGSFFTGLGTPQFISAIAYMGIASTVMGFCLMAYSANGLSVEVYACLNTIYTLVSLCVSTCLLHETLDALDIIGTAIILCGVVGVSVYGHPRSHTQNHPGKHIHILHR